MMMMMIQLYNTYKIKGRKTADLDERPPEV